jgi:diguanylate cyclase (GGDEF)-like protein
VFHRSRRKLNKQWREFWRAPDALLADQGGSGEQAVARIRFLVIGTLFLFGFFELRDRLGSSGTEMVLVAAVVALAFAVTVQLVSRRGQYRNWLGFVSSIMDVTLVSAVLLVFLLIDQPHFAVNNRVMFAVYLVAIAATSLRYDPRICVLTGLISIGQYAGIVAYADTNWALNSAEFAPFADGMFNLTAHYERLVLMACATLISTMAVTRAQRLRDASARDPLTGLLSRGFFDEMAAAEVARTKRYDRVLSVAMIDVDNFKSFNDQFGHGVGDEVLTLIAKMLRSTRKSDLVARYGGEEFIIVFPETPIEAAVHKAEQIRKVIEPSSVTVSIGVASLPIDGSDLRTVVDRADQRLYEAKRGGRNRVVGPPGVEVSNDAGSESAEQSEPAPEHVPQ